MSLEYTIKRDESRRLAQEEYVIDAVRFKAEPSEWASHISGEVLLKWPWALPDEGEPPVIRSISWSTGARDWTTADARKFFNAGLRLLDALDQELAFQKSKKEYEERDRG